MNGYTPEPTNPERLAYDAERKAYWDAKSLAYAQSHDEEGDGLPWLVLSDAVSIAITPKVISFMPDEEPWNKIPDSDTTPKLPPAKINTLQQLADAQAVSFNERYYHNSGLPYFPHENRGA
jgi:hypothetical protein